MFYQMKRLFNFITLFFLFAIFVSCSNNPNFLNTIFEDWIEVENKITQLKDDSQTIFQTDEYNKFQSDFQLLCESSDYLDYLSIYFDDSDNYFSAYINGIRKGIENKDVELIRNTIINFELITKKQNFQASEYYLNVIISLSVTLFVFFHFLFLMIKRYEKETENKEQIGVYTAFVMSGIEKERKRLSHEIHDTVLQDLRFAQMEVESLEQNDREKFEASQKKILDAVKKSISGLRNTCQNLTPTELKNVKDDNTLITAIRNLCARFEEQNNIPCVLSIQNDIYISEVSLEKSLNIFRILQEALNNIQNHAKANYVSVMLKNGNKAGDKDDEKNHLIIYITDDGVGFDVDKAEKNNHFGLKNMKERAKLIDADLTIQSDEDTGTEIKLVL